MAKRFRTPKLREVEPQGPVHTLDAPLAVEFRINWEPPFQVSREDHIVAGWALAFTRTEGLVVWVQTDHAITAWLPADHIRRR